MYVMITMAAYSKSLIVIRSFFLFLLDLWSRVRETISSGQVTIHHMLRLRDIPPAPVKLESVKARKSGILGIMCPILHSHLGYVPGVIDFRRLEISARITVVICVVSLLLYTK